MVLERARGTLTVLRRLPGQRGIPRGSSWRPLTLHHDRRSLLENIAPSEGGFDVTAQAAIMHVPRVIASAARRGGPRLLLAFERLGRLRTRYVTGQFVAARAVAC